VRGADLALVILAAGRAKRYGGCKPLAPVGPQGEAVIDLVASDALAAGFGAIVLVLSPSTGPAIRYHVEHTWPGVTAVPSWSSTCAATGMPTRWSGTGSPTPSSASRP